jgi:transmembrane sensor
MSRPGIQTSEDLRLEEAGAWCVRIADGELQPRERAAFEAWLDASPENRAAFDQAVEVWRALEESSLSPSLIDIRRSALDSFQRANRSKWAHGFSRRWRMAAALAGVLLLGAVSWGWLHYVPSVYETRAGERRTVVLSDGSRLSLDAATKVSVRYIAGRRDLRLIQGRAKFNVAKDPLRPFSVAAADKLVVATGTEFSVELLRHQMHVILYEGRVAVLRSPTAQTGPAPVRLASLTTAADQALLPGRELVATVGQPTAEVAVTDPGRTLSWEGGQLVFADEPLASAVERVNRYSGDSIAIGDPAAGATLINGVYAAGDTAAFIEGVTSVSPIGVRDVDGQKVLFSRR